MCNPEPASMRPKTKEEIVKELGITGTFDYAIPMGWVDHVREVLGTDEPITAHFIYEYFDSPFGGPYPITERGKEILREYNEKAGTSYPIPD